MQRLGQWVAIGAVSALALSACGGGGDDSTPATPPVSHSATVTPVAQAGSYSVAVQQGDTVLAGTYLQADDGQALIVLNGNNERATAVYSKSAGDNAWQVSGSQAPTELVLAHTSVNLSTASITLNELAGDYQTLLDDMSSAALSISPTGAVSTQGSGCQISGSLSPTHLGSVLAANLKTAQCSQLPAQFTGYAVADANYAPAKLRLIAASSTQVNEVWLHAK